MDALRLADAEAAEHAVAPRVSLADIEGAILKRLDLNAGSLKLLHHIPRTELPQLDVLSTCVLVMKNGFTVIGKSAPASPANFDPMLGCKLAYEDCIRQLWPLMGFALRDKLSYG